MRKCKYINTLLVKKCGVSKIFEKFLKEVSFAHQGCIYLIKKIIQNFVNNIVILNNCSV